MQLALFPGKLYLASQSSRLQNGLVVSVKNGYPEGGGHSRDKEVSLWIDAHYVLQGVLFSSPQELTRIKTDGRMALFTLMQP